MPITFVAAGTVALNNSAATTLNVPYPTGLAAGDVIAMAVGVNSATIASLPSGWLAGGVSSSSGGNAPSERIMLKICDGTETGSVAVTTPNVTSRGQMLAFRGVDNTTPLDNAGSVTASATATNTYALPSMTTTTPGAALILVGVANAPGGTWTSPTSPGTFTETAETTGATPSTGIQYLIWTGSGATGTVNYTRSTNVRGCTGMLALRPAATGSPGAGTGSGTVTTTGVGTGRRNSVSSAAGTVTATGAGVGRRTPRATGTATTTCTSTATGTRNPRSTATGTTTSTGTGVGVRNPRGTGSGTTAATAAGVGRRTPRSNGTGTVTCTSSAAGTAPPVAGATGTGTGAATSTGTAVGRRTPRSTGTGLCTITGTGTAHRHPRSSGTGQTTTLGNGTGYTLPLSASESTTTVVGTGIGQRPGEPTDFAGRILGTQLTITTTHATLATPTTRSHLDTDTTHGHLTTTHTTSRLTVPTATGDLE